MVRFGSTTLAVLMAAHAADAHTWLEYLRRISPTGAFVGEPGYAKGYMPRNADGFTDLAVQHQILELQSNPVVCRQFDQGGYKNAEYRPLTASAGEYLALQYEENGHTTEPTVTPRGYRGGNVYVYGTMEHTDDVRLTDVLYVWNTDGTGGNQKGKLLASHFFDDGICYQNKGDTTKYPIYTERKAKYGKESINCQSDVQLPTDLPTDGTYTLYWVWDWPLNPGQVGNTTEIYTSCADISLAAPGPDSSAKMAFKYVEPVDIASHAILSQIETQIEVVTNGVGTASPAAPTVTRTAAPAMDTASAVAPQDTAAPAAAPPVSAPIPSVSASAVAQSTSAVQTVYVTADVVTKTEYLTVTASTPAPTALAAVATGRPVSIEPFLKARVTGSARRAARAA